MKTLKMGTTNYILVSKKISAILEFNTGKKIDDLEIDVKIKKNGKGLEVDFK